MRFWGFEPSIIAAALDMQCATLAVSFDKGILYSDSLAKYAVAFFKKSRSFVIRRNSARRRRFSAVRSSCVSRSLLGTLKRLSQLYSVYLKYLNDWQRPKWGSHGYEN